MVMTSATRNYTVALLVVAAVGVRTSTAAGAAIYRHKWGTVADVMGMLQGVNRVIARRLSCHYPTETAGGNPNI